MNKEKLRKIYLIVLAVYVALVTSFYFLAGDQIRYTESKENTEFYTADSITDEINKNNSISQIINCPIDRLESVELVFTKNYHEGKGKVNIYVFSGPKIIAKDYFDITIIYNKYEHENFCC